ncbi:hypothetical protein RZS08_64260, partial [Arthrospira platensis SPKY1]|nr:hypothetical protein [Arthrospira platensis SPKY1]
DLSRNAAAAFGRLLPIARALGATVHVENVLPVRELPLFMSGAGSRAQYDAEIAAERARAETSLGWYRDEARAAGVAVEARVDEESASLPVGESLEARAAGID